MTAQLRETTTGNTFDLADFTLIGRSEGVTIRLADAGISRHHATIRRDGEHYWLLDLGSANGSYVNEVALSSARALADGDRIRLAECVLIFTHGMTSLPAATANVGTTVAPHTSPPVARETLTMLVADLKDFTSISQFLGEEQVALLLREWYGDCRNVLHDRGATIDKFMGDCVFAYWHGADATVRLKALQAAQALRAVETTAATPMREVLRERHGIGLDCRVGMHVGSVAIGSIGKDVNTALGDAVNIAFSIEALTRAVGRPILASAGFVDGWQGAHLHFEPHGLHPIKGHAHPIEVFAARQVP